MTARRWLVALAVAATALGLAGPAPAARPDAARNVFLEIIGMLSGQGLVVGHAALEGIAERFDKGLLDKDKALAELAAMGRYAEVVGAAFTERLMPQLSRDERKDLSLVIAFYDVERAAIGALADYVRTGKEESRRAFDEFMAKIEEIIRQISLGGGMT